MNEDDLKRRTKQFALRVMKLVDALPKTVSGRAMGSQLFRAATSVGANYRAACRGRSRAEFIAKLGFVVEEIDESEYWLDLIVEGGLLPATRVKLLQLEAGELVAIFVASKKSAQSKIENQKSKMR